jgi:hypothetical protein
MTLLSVLIVGVRESLLEKPRTGARYIYYIGMSLLLGLSVKFLINVRKYT